MGRIPEHFITARLRLPVVKRNGRGLATPSGDLPFTLPLLVADDASVYLPASDFVCLPPLSGSQSGPGLRPHLSLSFIASKNMSSAQIEIRKGRVVATERPNAALSLHELGLWSCVTSEGVYHTANAREGAGPRKLLDCIFYVNKGDAWEESAYLLGKRPDESADETSIRRSRSVGGGIKKGISLTVAGTMKIGRVDGEYNSAGSGQRGVTRTQQQSPATDVKHAVAAVTALKSSMVGLRTDKFPHTYRDVVTLREAYVVAETTDQVQVQLKASDGTETGKAWVVMPLAVAVFGKPVGWYDKDFDVADWPIMARIAIATSHASHAPCQVLDESTGRMSVRTALLTLAHCGGLGRAADYEAVFAADDPGSAFVDWMLALENRISKLAAVGGGRSGVDRLLAAARGHIEFGETLELRLVGEALAAAEAQASERRVTFASPDAAATQELLSARRPFGSGGSAVRPMQALSSAGGTTRDIVDDGTGVFDTSRRSTALAGATPNDALVLADDDRHGVLESCKFALCFYAAAASLIAFDMFLRVSALRTMSPMLRESTFSGAMDGHSRRTAAAALDAYFQDHIEADVGAVRAMLPQAVTVLGSDGLESAQLSDVFRGFADNATFNLQLQRERAGAGGAGPAPPIRVLVGGDARIGWTDDDETRSEYTSLARDAVEVQGSTPLQQQLGELEGYAVAADYGGLHKALTSAGAPLRRMALSPTATMVSKAITQAQWAEGLMQTLLTVRNGLEQRTHLSVFGSAATEPTSGERNVFAQCRQGHLGKAKPALLVPGAAASTQADPLSFLEKLPGHRQEAALCGAFLLIVAALQVSFPVQASATMRFFLKVQRWIHDQRGAGATWPLLSAWYAGLCRRADKRVDKVLQRQVDVLPSLDTEWVEDPGASYNRQFQIARAPELAAAAAAAEVAKVKPQKRERGDRGGKSGGGGGSGGGEKEPTSKKAKGKAKAEKQQQQQQKQQPQPQQQQQSQQQQGGGGPLLLTDLNSNVSGKTLADKTKIWTPGTEWKLPAIQEALQEEMGDWNGKKPCAFHFVGSRGCTRGEKCSRYH